jgi:hypothetical protein
MRHGRRRTRIVINGVEYSDPGQVPERYRHLVEDRDGDGIPDHIEPQMEEAVDGTTVIRTRYVVNGREYASLEEMPPHVRALFADADRNGVPDIAQTGPGMPPASRRARPVPEAAKRAHARRVLNRSAAADEQGPLGVPVLLKVMCVLFALTLGALAILLVLRLFGIT